jgi:hypothetical protein
MKLINYNYGYYNEFDCSIHGKIIVSPKEWAEVKKWLKRKAKAINTKYLWLDILQEDFARLIETKQGNLCNIRTTATNLIAKKYGLKKYKHANYMFLITK